MAKKEETKLSVEDQAVAAAVAAANIDFEKKLEDARIEASLAADEVEAKHQQELVEAKEEQVFDGRILTISEARKGFIAAELENIKKQGSEMVIATKYRSSRDNGKFNIANAHKEGVAKPINRRNALNFNSRSDAGKFWKFDEEATKKFYAIKKERMEAKDKKVKVAEAQKEIFTNNLLKLTNL